jgi:hypothetical protein
LVKAFRLSMKYPFFVNKICKTERVCFFSSVELIANKFKFYNEICL